MGQSALLVAPAAVDADRLHRRTDHDARRAMELDGRDPATRSRCAADQASASGGDHLDLLEYRVAEFLQVLQLRGRQLQRAGRLVGSRGERHRFDAESDTSARPQLLYILFDEL